MTPERWREVERVYHGALARTGSQRLAFLADVSDEELRSEVNTLLDHERSASGFLGFHAMEVAAREETGELPALVPGRQIGPYRIVCWLGAGGMGEVYRALDTNLGREVAIKVLPPVLAHDPDRLARFEREAQMLAAVNHPHIGGIYGIENVDGTPGLILELVEGVTLAQRIANGSLPISEALSIALQIADALEAAHDKGVVHRDLKPANVKITPEGIVKVLDFGLAKIVGGTASETDLTGSVTVTLDRAGVRRGIVLGTPAYMSPEQSRGDVVDKRTDIWAFGCVLFEMLTGRAAFAGDNPSEIIARIGRGEPDWRALPMLTPTGVRRLLQRCLEKDSKQRLRDIADTRADLTPDNNTDIPAERRVSAARPRKIVIGLAALSLAMLVAIVTAAGLWVASRPPSPVRSSAVRFVVTPPQGGAFAGDVERNYVAFSPDGSQLALIAAERTGVTRIWLRSVSAIDSRLLSGTEGATSLFWSPDSRALAFFAGNKLKRVDLPGGAAVPLCDVPQSIGLAGTWGEAGEILFASIEGDAIFSVSTSGRASAPLITPDRSRREARVNWPWFLPDGRRFVYLSRLTDGSGQLMLGRKGRTPKPLLTAVSNVQWVDPNYLVFVREGILVGQRFDLEGERIVGEPFSIAEPVDYSFSTARATFTTSRNGNVAYQSHRNVERLVWNDRNGRALSDLGTAGGYQSIRLSRDGATLLFDRTQPDLGTVDLWTLDIRRAVEMRLTSDPGSEAFGVWLPDSHGVVFMADRGGPPHLFRKNLLTAREDELLPAGRLQQPLDVTPDGTAIAFEERTARGNYDVLALSLITPGPPTVLLGSRFDELGLRFSPDGRAVVFLSDESGGYEVYAAPFPAMRPIVRVSSGDASLGQGRSSARRPQWSPTGREVFYQAGDRLMSVPVRTKPSLEVGTPVALFAVRDRPAWGDFAVSPDGERFLSIVSTVRASEQPLTVVLNWPAETGRR